MTKEGRAVDLAAREFDLLHLLMANAGEVIRREQIMDEVWDPHWFGPTKTLDVHISWLRKKLEDDPARPRYITTVRLVAAAPIIDEGTSYGAVRISQFMGEVQDRVRRGAPRSHETPALIPRDVRKPGEREAGPEAPGFPLGSCAATPP